MIYNILNTLKYNYNYYKDKLKWVSTKIQDKKEVEAQNYKEILVYERG